MPKACSRGVTALLGALVVLAAAPASAQMDLAGDWRALMHEDRDERIPGPELGEFFGIPINDAARWRAELWRGPSSCAPPSGRTSRTNGARAPGRDNGGVDWRPRMTAGTTHERFLPLIVAIGVRGLQPRSVRS